MEKCAPGLEFMVVKPHPVAMIQDPKWGIFITSRSAGNIYVYNYSVLTEIQNRDLDHTINIMHAGKETEITFCITVMSYAGDIFDHFPVSTFVGQREWSVTSLVDCTCT